MSASVLRSWCTHTRSSWWFLPTGEQSSAQERPVANRRARRAHTSRYAHIGPSMWVSDRATRSGGKILGRASGCFSPGLARKASACDYEQVGEFLDTFLALWAPFRASSFHGPFFWLSHSWFVMSCECVSWWGLGVRGYTQADKLSRKCFHIVVKPGLHNFSPNLVSFQFEINHKWKFKLGDLESNIWLSSLLWRIGKISHMRSKCGPRRVLL